MSLFRKKPKTPDEMRKSHSERWLKANRVQICNWLPGACEDGCEIREREEIINRILAIHCVFAKSYICLQDDGDPDKIRKVYDLTGGLQYLSPAERTFIDDPDPSEQVMVQFHWQIECMYALWWSLNPQDDLLEPSQLCDMQHLTSECRPGKMSDGQDMQPSSIIRDAFDLYYRLHWAVVEASLAGDDDHAAFVSGAVTERRRALTWLCDTEFDWDEVDMST
jgi:hypothetical protein